MGEKAARKGKIKFTITTNCLLIDDDFIRFVNEYDMQVVLSLTGERVFTMTCAIQPGAKALMIKSFPRCLNFLRAGTMTTIM